MGSCSRLGQSSQSWIPSLPCSSLAQLKEMVLASSTCTQVKPPWDTRVIEVQTCAMIQQDFPPGIIQDTGTHPLMLKPCQGPQKNLSWKGLTRSRVQLLALSRTLQEHLQLLRLTTSCQSTSQSTVHRVARTGSFSVRPLAASRFPLSSRATRPELGSSSGIPFLPHCKK